jgi:putative transcriptional regulator
MANHLTDLRKKAGFKTAKQLADKLKISMGMVYQMEGGLKKPSVSLALKMAKLYNCSLEDIFLPRNTTDSDKK